MLDAKGATQVTVLGLKESRVLLVLDLHLKMGVDNNMEVLWEKKSCWPSSVHDDDGGGGGGGDDYEDDDQDIDNGSHLLNICLWTTSYRTFHIEHSQETGAL